MGNLLQFVDAVNTSLGVSLINNSGLSILFGSGSPQRALNPDDRVIDTYQCKVVATSDNDLAAQLIALTRILENATRYDQDSTEENEIWLLDQLAGETNPRRTLVLGGSWQFDKNPRSVPTSNEHTAFITLALKHMAGYESTTFSYITSNTLSVMGGSVDLSISAVGDMPARAEFTLRGATGTLDTLWLGMRSYKKHPDGSGGLTHFVPVWEAEIGTAGTNTAAVATYDSTSTGSGSNKSLLVSFANASWAERLRITVADVAGGWDNGFGGRFLVLGRMRLDTGTDTVQVRLRSGWYSASATPQYKTLDPVTVAGTDYQYYELGTVKFPPITGSLYGYPAGVGYIGLSAAALSLIAARTSGTTSKLIIDHLAIIPIDEGFSKISGLNLTSSDMAVISETPKNTGLSARADHSTGTFNSSPPFSQQGFYIPFGISSVYVFGQRSGISVIGDTVDFLSQSHSRYYSLRGAV